MIFNIFFHLMELDEVEWLEKLNRYQEIDQDSRLDSLEYEFDNYYKTEYESEELQTFDEWANDINKQYHAKKKALRSKTASKETRNSQDIIDQEVEKTRLKQLKRQLKKRLEYADDWNIIKAGTDLIYKLPIPTFGDINANSIYTFLFDGDQQEKLSKQQRDVVMKQMMLFHPDRIRRIKERIVNYVQVLESCNEVSSALNKLLENS